MSVTSTNTKSSTSPDNASPTGPHWHISSLATVIPFVDMPPDLNSLPISRPPSLSSSPLSHRPRRISITATADTARPSPPSPRSPSLAAAAAINAGLQRSPTSSSPVLERRRSSLMNSLTNTNDPTVSAPGESQFSSNGVMGSPRFARRSFALSTADPHRQPSLGELHQELENEQEAQVNRLLHMIRLQQDQLAAVQRQFETEPSLSTADYSQLPHPPLTNATAASPEHTSSRSGSMAHTHGHRPHSLSRRSSSRLSTTGTNSRGTSPALRPQSGSLGPLNEDFLLGGTRDDCAFYQAETQMLTRENQMLKLRIRELERQISDLGSVGTLTSQSSHHSSLSGAPATFTSGAAPPVPAEVDATVKVD